jgi:MFS family permease
MKTLLRDTRVQRLLVANTLGSIGSGITIFSVPWLLVHEPNGNAAFRWATIATTVVLFAIMPYYGAWVDRHSRKAALLTSEAWGFFAAGTMAVLGFVLGGFSTTQLMVIYFCGMSYYSLHYPAKFAFVQQIFDRSQYQSLMGLLEIQGQTAMMIAGGLGGWLVEHVPLWTILAFDAATYLASFAIQSTIPYEATHLQSPAGTTSAAPRVSVWGSVAEGWRWLRDQPRLTVFLTCSLMPFIAVMVGNYLFPIYVAQTLQAGAGWFAGGEITFAFGAILAGFILPRLIAQHSAATTIPGTILVFLLGLVLIVALPHPLVYLTAAILCGFGNAGCRVARSALMLNLVPNAVMGRVGVFYNVLDRVLRTVLVSAMVIVDVHGPPAGFGLLFGILLLAFVGVMLSRNVLRPTTPAAAASS